MTSEAIPTIFNSESYRKRPILFSTHVLREKLEEANKKVEEQFSQIQRLTEEIEQLKTELEEKNYLDRKLKGVFNQNQIMALSDQKKPKGFRWENSTFEKALKLKFVCGTAGYKYLLKLNHPLPNIRTLSLKIQHLAFQPGILHEIFYYLKIKIQNLTEIERYCCMQFDAAAITPSKEYCTSSSKIVGYDTLSQLPVLACHVLVFLLSGITTSWKQIIAYHFIGDSVEGSKLGNVISEILVLSNQIGINVVNITSDMGPDNQATWKYFGIKSKKTLFQNFIQHPNDPIQKVYFMADPPHLLKNIRSCLVNNKIIQIPDFFVQKYNLPSNIVDVKHITWLAEYQQDMDLKFCPKLDTDFSKLNHFNKMKVSNAYYVLNSNVSSALNFLCEVESSCDKNAMTTAWFIQTISKWFAIMTSRNDTLAFSKLNPIEYHQTIEFLNEIVLLFKNIKIGEKGIWKPIQTGVILSTQTILNLQDFFLNTHNFKFLKTAPFSQDGLENIFGQMRLAQKVPTAVQCRHLLKNLSVFQYLDVTPENGSYTAENNPNILDIDSIVSKKQKATNNDLVVLSNCLPEHWNENKPTLNEIQKNLLYNSAGYILKNIRKKIRCTVCQKYILCKKIMKPFAKLVTIKQYKPNCLNFATPSVFKIFLRIEQIFLNLSKHLPSKNYNFLGLFKNIVLEDPDISKITMPVCHNVKTKIINAFCLFRIRVYLNKIKKHIKRDVLLQNEYANSSKSAKVSITFGN